MNDTSAIELDHVTTCELCDFPAEGARFVLEADGHKCVMCSSCCLVFLNPRPREQDIVRLYNDTYYAFRVPPKETLRQRLRDDCLLDLGGYPRRQRPLWMSVASGLIRLVRGGQTSVILPYPGEIGRQPRVLDIGCGSGDFLAWAAKAGWEPHGLEIVEAGVKRARARGLEVFHGTIEQAHYQDDFFDAIHSDNAFEHMRHPMSAMIEARRVLRPDGLFIICVPNFGGSNARLLGPCWDLLHLPHHLYQFTAATLSAMLEKAGFRIERVHHKSFFIPYSERNSFRKLREAISRGEAGGSMRRYWRLRWELSIMRRIQVGFGLGDPAEHGQFITAYCRKA